MAALATALLLAACGSGEDADARLAARRAALGLGGSASVPFAEAMARMQAKAFEGLLHRVGSKALPPGEALDAALEIEDLLARADAANAAARPPNPPVFDARLAASRGRALELARALARGRDGIKEAAEVVASCFDCHVMFRAPR
jgi:hypothetical protein